MVEAYIAVFLGLAGEIQRLLEKGGGNSMGKQLASRKTLRLPKNPAVALSFLSYNGNSVDHQAILAQLPALEQVQGFSPGGFSQKHFQAEELS